MSPRFEIVEAKSRHCGQMMRRLRADHRFAILRLGANGHQGLRDSFDQSWFRRAWLIDGRLAGLGGVSGSSVGYEGYVWLALSEEAMRYPLEIVREGRRQIAIILRTVRALRCTVLDDDEVAKRFAIFMGFVPLSAPLSRAETRYGRRTVLDTLAGCDEDRVPVGHGSMLAMRYDMEAA